MPSETAAAAAAAAARVRRAAGLLRDAGRDLAALADSDVTVLGTTHVHDADSADAVRDLIALGIARHGVVEVVVIARPRRRTHPSTTAPAGAKGSPHGSTT